MKGTGIMLLFSAFSTTIINGINLDCTSLLIILCFQMEFINKLQLVNSLKSHYEANFFFFDSTVDDTRFIELSLNPYSKIFLLHTDQLISNFTRIIGQLSL